MEVTPVLGLQALHLADRGYRGVPRTRLVGNPVNRGNEALP